MYVAKPIVYVFGIVKWFARTTINIFKKYFFIPEALFSNVLFPKIKLKKLLISLHFLQASFQTDINIDSNIRSQTHSVDFWKMFFYS